WLSPAGDPAAEEWSQWSVCSLTCGQGSQVRTRSCVSSPYGTLCSGLLRETRTCNNTATCPAPPVQDELAHPSVGRTSPARVPASRGGARPSGRSAVGGDAALLVPAVEGQWLEWGAWSRCSVTCANGTQQRTRKCSVSAHGWAECRGAHADARECSNPTCPSKAPRARGGAGGRPRVGARPRHRGVTAGDARSAGGPLRVMAGITGHVSAGGAGGWRCPRHGSRWGPVGARWWRVPPCFGRRSTRVISRLREHLAKGQRVLAGEGMSQVVRSLLELMARKTYYSGDLLFSVDILRNVTDTFKRATYIPSSEDVQRFFQVVSYMVDAENRDKWEDAQQVSPGSVHLMKVVEDFIHLVGNALKAFQSSLIVTDNLVSPTCHPHKCPLSHAVIVTVPSHGVALPHHQPSLSSTSSFITTMSVPFPSHTIHVSPCCPITVSPPSAMWVPVTCSTESWAGTSSSQCAHGGDTPALGHPGNVPKGHISWWGGDRAGGSSNLSLCPQGTSHPQCVTWDYSRTDAGLGNWDTESCQTLETLPAHTKCQCRQLATFAVLAQLPRDLAMDPSGTPSVPLMIGCAVSCMALLTLLVIYAAFWRFIKSERSIILLNFCVSILASNILILVGQSQMLSKGVCTMTAAFLHFFFLSSFCWVLTEAWQSYLAVIGRIRTRLVRKRFLCLGWGLPALVVAVSVGFTRTKGYGTASYCWLSLEGGLLYAFVGPAAVIVLVNMLVGIIVFNKLMSRDGISDKSKKQRAGSKPPPCGSLLLKCTKCGVVSSAAMTSATASSAMASLWSSCVVLPLLALTWMSAVLAMTDRRSILFQVLFAVFNSVQGFVIITVHGFLRREVQDVVKCQMGGCRSEENENSPDSCKNGQVQILTDFEKDVDLACQTVLFKEVNTCNPATITGTLSRISLDGDEDPKLNTTSEGGLGFSSLPGNIPPASILVQVPKMTPNVVAGLTELGEPPAQQLGLEAPGPVYLCTESSLRPLEYGWIRAPEPPRESDYMMLPRRTGSLKPFPRGDEGTLGAGAEEAVPGGTGRPAAEGDAYPGFVAVDHVNVNLNQPYATVKAPYGLQFKQHPTVRQILASELSERSRTMPRTVPGSAMKVGSLERKRLRYSDLDFEKVMHTRKRHSELYHELNQKFHT
ncbi:AGRB3 protein, partial [Prunella himalayana]|nr:AGRB3 protein [Prunella himalayana]